MERVAEKNASLQMSAEEVSEERKERLAAIDYKMVAFSLAGKDYAIDIMRVKEIAKAGRFTYVPNTAPFVIGVYNLRGDIIPIIDLRLFFNIEVPPRKGDELENLIIVSVADQSFGVVVDAIDKVVGIQKSTIQPPHPLFGDINIKYIYGVVESNSRLYILLDIEKIFGVKTAQNTRAEKESSIPDNDHAGENSVKKAVVHTTNFHQEIDDDKTQNTAAVQQNHENAKTPISSAAAKKTQPAAEKSLPTAVSQSPVKKAEADAVPLDYDFIIQSLETLGTFYVSDINEPWVRSRFVEWSRERSGKNIQFSGKADAETFISSFYSQCTSSFWTQQYADAVYKALPENYAKQINVWNIGCGKGHESYSLACLLKRRYPDARIRIFAHDTNLLNVSNAPLLTVPPEHAGGWYNLFLTKTVNGDDTFAQEIKDMILFEYHDCTNTNSMPNVDIIFCRDVISFLPLSSQNAVLEDFEEKLKGNGVLFLGENENLSNRMRWNEKNTGAVSIYTKQ